MKTNFNFILLIILDGWGLGLPGPQNAIYLAKTPKMNQLGVSFCHAKLAASGKDVGLPPGEMGNSEVGHMNLGAGRIVYQDLLRINTSIADGSFFEIPVLIDTIEKAKQKGQTLHLIGLVSPGGVHSNIDHLFALLRLTKEHNLTKVVVHMITDGRDTGPRSSPLYIDQLEKEMSLIGVGKIASVSGRYYAMDRDLRWRRTELAYDCLTCGSGKQAKSALDAVGNSYRDGRTDEFILPTVIVDPDNRPIGLIRNGDSVIFFNFRTDRPKQLTAALVLPDFESAQIRPPVYDPYLYKFKTPEPESISSVNTFKRKVILKDLYFVTLTHYDKNLPVPSAFTPIGVELPLAEILSENDFSQFHIAETEKYPHVTYFFNGGREEPFPGEVRELIPSPKVDTYDLSPEMSATEITARLIARLRLRCDHFLLVNYANPDMVAHTGVIPAGIKACEVVDQHVGRVIREVENLGGFAIVTADHGNAEIMLTAEGSEETEHSTSPVPCIFVHESLRGRGEVNRGRLADVAPTILNLLGLSVPSVMSGRNLLDTG